MIKRWIWRIVEFIHPEFLFRGSTLLSLYFNSSYTHFIHSTRYTLYTLYTLHTLHSSHSTHSTLYTLYNLHSSLSTLYTLYTLHSTLYTLHSTLYTLHSTLYTLHSTGQSYSQHERARVLTPPPFDLPSSLKYPICNHTYSVSFWNYAETISSMMGDPPSQHGIGGISLR